MRDRRDFLRGLATLPLFGGVTALPALAFSAPHSNDLRLGAIADELAALQAQIDTYKGDDDGFAEINDRFSPLMSEMDGIDADTFAGVLHKLRAIELPGVGEDGEAHDIMCSICSDITRMHGAGSIVSVVGMSLTGSEE